MDEILFHLRTGAYGFLSNFYPLPRPILLDGTYWATSEHYYQAQKFIGTDPAHAEAIRTAKRPYDPWRMGNGPSRPIREDWDRVKNEVMITALRAKFGQNPELGKLLLATGEARLV